MYENIYLSVVPDVNRISNSSRRLNDVNMLLVDDDDDNNKAVTQKGTQNKKTREERPN